MSNLATCWSVNQLVVTNNLYFLLKYSNKETKSSFNWSGIASYKLVVHISRKSSGTGNFIYSAKYLDISTFLNLMCVLSYDFIAFWKLWNVLSSLGKLHCFNESLVIWSNCSNQGIKVLSKSKTIALIIITS